MSEGAGPVKVVFRRRRRREQPVAPWADDAEIHRCSVASDSHPVGLSARGGAASQAVTTPGTRPSWAITAVSSWYTAWRMTLS